MARHDHHVGKQGDSKNPHELERKSYVAGVHSTHDEDIEEKGVAGCNDRLALQALSASVEAFHNLMFTMQQARLI